MPPRRRTNGTGTTKPHRKVAGHIIGWEEPVSKGRNGHTVNWQDIADEVKSGRDEKGQGKWALVKVNKVSNTLSASRASILNGRYSGFKDGDKMWEAVVCKRTVGGFGLFVRWKGDDVPEPTIDFEEPTEAPT